MGEPTDLERELVESHAREAALAEVLAVMRRAPAELVTVLETVLDRAARLCGAERASIHLLDGEVYRTAAFWGPNEPEYQRVAYDTTRRPGRETLIGRTALERAVVHIPDALADLEYTAKDLQRLGGYRTMLGVPLFRGEIVAGVFVLTRNEVHPFTDHEIALVRAFADQAVVAVENARLLKATTDALDRQTAIADLMKEMSTSVFDLDRVLESIAANAVRLCAADNGSIARVKGDTWELVATAGDEGAREALAQNWASRKIEPDRRSITGRVLTERHTVTIADVLTDPEYDRGAGLFGFRSVAGVPLKRGRDIIGVLIVRRSEPTPFTTEQLHLLETFADQAAIAIENVRLFNETKESLRQQTAVSDVLKTISRSAFDLQPVLQIVTENAARLAEADIAWLSRAEGDRFRTVAFSSGFPDRVKEAIEEIRLKEGPTRPVGPTSGVMGIILDERKTLHVPDASADPVLGRSRVVSLTGVKTVLGVPMIREDRVIGGMVLARYASRPFSAREIELADTFADQAAIAIENVELFETVERQRQELSRFLSPQVAELVTSKEGAKMLEGHRRAITVVFCDLRNFTTFAETAEPEEVLGVLRDYHRAMGEIIVAHQGTLEHFAGDGMMVFFNDPLPVERHELQAVRMGTAMRARFAEMALTWEKRGYTLGFGVGIATGYATLGRIGFEGRYDYGAIGNVVILAQRLSAEAKAGQILMSQRVHAAVENEVTTTAVGDLSLKGFSRPVPAFAAEPIAAAAPAT